MAWLQFGFAAGLLKKRCRYVNEHSETKTHLYLEAANSGSLYNCQLLGPLRLGCFMKGISVGIRAWPIFALLVGEGPFFFLFLFG